MKVVLLGYMASGKSLIGKKLAQILDYNFIDLDELIEAKHAKSISDIFSDKGEIYFRKEEHNSLKDVLSRPNDLVLSLGGGTPCYASNMNMLLEMDNVLTIYLDVSLKLLVERLQEEKYTRPLVSHITNQNDLYEFVGKHLFERSHYYRQASVIVDANSNPEIIVESILLKLF